MKKLYIVKNTRDFEKIINCGKLHKSRYFIIYHLPNFLPYNRYGISVGKKIGNAVNRNKYKRKLRAIIDNIRNDYVNSEDYIIILKGSSKDKTYQELNEDFVWIINKIRKEETRETQKN